MIDEWLRNVEYPGYTFLRADHDEGPLIGIEFTVKDSRGPGDQTQRVWTFVPPFRHESDFYDWLKWRLQRIAIHEVNEFLTVKGSLWHDPHRRLEAQFR